MFKALRTIALLRRLDKTSERCAVVLERIAVALERGAAGDSTFRSNYDDPTGTSAVFNPSDEVLAEIFAQEGRLGRTLDEDELTAIFKGEVE